MPRRTPPAVLIGSGLIPTQFTRRAGDIEQQYQDTLAELGRNERNLYRDIGFTGAIDPTTGQPSFSLDPTNKFGSYQTMIRDFASNLVNSRSAMIGRGITRKGGLAGARERLLRFQLDQGKASTLSKFTQAAADIYGKRGVAGTTKNRAMGDLEGEALDWWNQYGPEDVSPPAAAAPQQAAPPAPEVLPQVPNLPPSQGGPYGAETQPYNPWAPTAPTPQQNLLQTMNRVIRRTR